MGSFGSSLRGVLFEVDPLLHCYAGDFLACVWNRISRKYSRAPPLNGLAPLQAREQRKRTRATGANGDGGADAMRRRREEWQSGLRRFGCLAFVLIQPRELLPKAVPRPTAAVLLGFRSLNSACVFGSCVQDDRCKFGERLSAVEPRDALFLEECLVGDVEQLFIAWDAGPGVRGTPHAPRP